MHRLGLLCAILTVGVGHPMSAQARNASALDSVRVAYHPFCQWGRCPPYSMVLRANGELTLAKDSAQTAVQVADSVVTHLFGLVHPVMASTFPARISDSRLLCNMVMTHQREVIVELFSQAAVRRIVDANTCQDTGRHSKDVDGWHPLFRNLRVFEAAIEALPSVSAWLRR